MGFYDQPGRDGRRVGDPLRDLARNPDMAPSWQLVRLVAADDDEDSRAIEGNGVNWGQYKYGHILVAPLQSSDLDAPLLSTTGNPTIQLMVWNPVLSLYVPLSPVVTFTGAGAGLPYSITFEALGRMIMPAVTGTVGGDERVAIWASGYDIDATL